MTQETKRIFHRVQELSPAAFSTLPMSDAEPSKPSESKHTAYIPGDDSSTRWRNTINLLLGRLSDEGVAQYKKCRDDRYEKEDCKRCEKHRDFMLKYSKIYCTASNEFKVWGD